MDFEEIKAFSAGVIREELAASGISVTRILLFGSRARGDARPDSDWDFFVCVDRELPFSEKAFISTAIQTRLAEKDISADVIIKSETKAARERSNVGVITYYALKNGIAV
jgi:uncharacterized protein